MAALLDCCIQDSFVCKAELYLTAQSDETQAGTLLRILELIYLWLAPCQFYIQVNERRKFAPAPLFSSLRGIFVFVPEHCGVQWQISASDNDWGV